MSSHPFADLIGLSTTEQRAGDSRCSLAVEEKHLNPHRVVHGAVIYALADTGMGGPLYPTLVAQANGNYAIFKPRTTGMSGKQPD